MRESVTWTVLTENERLFSQWWGRYVMDLTHGDIMAGAASSAALRAAESAWKTSALLAMRRAADHRRTRRRRAK
jgi:hypothetical protein